jgi:hypothetical protein
MMILDFLERIGMEKELIIRSKMPPGTNINRAGSLLRDSVGLDSAVSISALFQECGKPII